MAENKIGINENRAFRGIWVPAEIWLHKALTMQEKIFLVEIDSLDNKNGCYANNSYFAEFFGISTTRVSLVIKKLIDKGYIQSEIVYKEGTKQILNRVLKICRPPYPTFIKEGIQQILNTPTQQKLKDNNIDFNNTLNNINIPPSNPKLIQHKHGEYKHVLLTDEQYSKLQQEYSNYTELIKHLDEYLEMSGKKYKNHYLVIKKWVVDAVKNKASKQAIIPKIKKGDFLD